MRGSGRVEVRAGERAYAASAFKIAVGLEFAYQDREHFDAIGRSLGFADWAEHARALAAAPPARIEVMRRAFREAFALPDLVPHTTAAYTDGRRYAVAVFTRALDPDPAAETDPDTAARMAVEHLRLTPGYS